MKKHQEQEVSSEDIFNQDESSPGTATSVHLDADKKSNIEVRALQTAGRDMNIYNIHTPFSLGDLRGRMQAVNTSGTPLNQPVPILKTIESFKKTIKKTETKEGLETVITEEKVTETVYMKEENATFCLSNLWPMNYCDYTNHILCNAWSDESSAKTSSSPTPVQSEEYQIAAKLYY